MRLTQRITARSCATYVPRQGRVSMLSTGKWQVGDDGVLRPLVRAAVSGIDGRLVADDFLIDSGADRTVLSAALLARLSLPTRSAPSGSTLSGIGGGCAFVLVTSAVDQVIALLRQRGRVTYRTLQLQFRLDDAQLAALKDELLYSQPHVVDDAGRGLVWTGDPGSAPAAPSARVEIP